MVTTKAWSLGNGQFTIETPGYSIPPEKFVITDAFGELLEAIIKNGGIASAKELKKLTGISDPEQCIERALDNQEYFSLRSHITRPKRKGGGYRTTIRDRQNRGRNTLFSNEEVIGMLAHLVQVALPLADLANSDKFSPDDRSRLRELSGKSTIFELKNVLVRLCSEHARREL